MLISTLQMHRKPQPASDHIVHDSDDKATTPGVALLSHENIQQLALFFLGPLRVNTQIPDLVLQAWCLQKSLQLAGRYYHMFVFQTREHWFISYFCSPECHDLALGKGTSLVSDTHSLLLEEGDSCQVINKDQTLKSTHLLSPKQSTECTANSTTHAPARLCHSLDLNTRQRRSSRH